jgi:hypothetical protein
MTIPRIIAIVVVYLVACGGWGALGVATWIRSDQFRELLGEALEDQWGRPLLQQAPSFTRIGADGKAGEALMAEASELTVDLALDYRRKGLVWYPTYLDHFAADYTLANPGPAPQRVRAHLDFPSPQATYDGFELAVDGKPVEGAVDTAKGVDAECVLEPGQRRVVHVAYRTRGLGQWSYRPGGASGRTRNFRMVATTDFTGIDYPLGSLSPTTSEPLSGPPAPGTDAPRPSGLRLTWTAGDLLTRRDIGLVVPERLNPGPVASRITFFAPVCLGFFFVLIATITVVRRIPIHPMHYLFIAAGFFAFHLLLAYLVDQLDIHLAFALAAAVSVALVTSYLATALGRGFPWRVAAAGQGLFLVLFSYSFFLPGLTGLTVTIGAVVTLAVLMRVTAGIDWSQVFARRTAGKD